MNYSSIIEFKLIWIICTGCSFTLNMCLIHNFIMMWHAQLLFRDISCCSNDFPSAGATSHFILKTPFLAANSNRLFSFQYDLLLFIIIIRSNLLVDLLIIMHWMCYRVDIVVLQLIFVWKVDIAFVIDRWVHSIIDPLCDELQELFVDIQLEHNFNNLLLICNARVCSYCF